MYLPKLSAHASLIFVNICKDDFYPQQSCFLNLSYLLDLLNGKQKHCIEETKTTDVFSFIKTGYMLTFLLAGNQFIFCREISIAICLLWNVAHRHSMADHNLVS